MFLRRLFHSMSVNPVSQSPAAAIASLNQNLIQRQAQQKPVSSPLATPITPRDTVQLSAQAKAAVGDVDHDGDSH
jgi:hypothetical protein